MPLNKPTATPNAKPVRIASDGGKPQKLATYPVNAAVNPMTDPTERSMPAVRITSVIPPATTPIATELFNIVMRLVGWKKGRPEVTNSIEIPKIKIARKAPDHSVRKNRTIAEINLSCKGNFTFMLLIGGAMVLT